VTKADRNTVSGLIFAACRPGLESIQGLGCGDVLRQLVPSSNSSWEEGVAIHTRPTKWELDMSPHVTVRHAWKYYSP